MSGSLRLRLEAGAVTCATRAPAIPYGERAPGLTAVPKAVRPSAPAAGPESARRAALRHPPPHGLVDACLCSSVTIVFTRALPQHDAAVPPLLVPDPGRGR
jgi:hypothetical protein